MRNQLGIAIIGTGFMGACHANAWRSVKGYFGGDLAPKPIAIADVDLAAAQALAERYDYPYATADWQELIDDPSIDVISITSPNRFHAEMAIAALEAGKHVWCEKPMAANAAEVAAMVSAAAKTNAKTIVGYNYLRNPAIIHAKRLIDDGTLGCPLHFSGVNIEDFLADPASPWGWRNSKAASGHGVLGDLGGHMLSLAAFLVGDVDRVSGLTQVIHGSRPATGGPQACDTEDHASFITQFSSGAMGTFHTSWMSWGRKNHLTFELTCTQGSIRFDQERMNELQLYIAGESAEGVRSAGGPNDGWRTVLMGPHHPPFSAFCPAPGHGLGFNDLKVIEAKELLDAISEDRAAYPDFLEGEKIERTLDAVAQSSQTGVWQAVAATN